MASSLSSQLQRLRTEGGVATGSKRKVHSFLFSAKEVVNVDDETVFNLAMNGLLELNKVDTRFEEFSETLFSSTKIKWSRSHATKEEMVLINDSIRRFLQLSSKFMLLKATHKTLEFLVRRYEIHLWNVDDIMQAMLCYHESPVFARMVQLLEIKNTSWDFLKFVKKSGQPLTRMALVQRCIRDSSLITFLSDTMSVLGVENAKVISFYTVVVLEYLDKVKSIQEEQMRWLLPQLIKGIKCNDVPDQQASAYMILSKLSCKTTLSRNVSGTLVASIAKNVAQGRLETNALMCLMCLVETQAMTELSSKATFELLKQDQLPQLLQQLMEKYDGQIFIRLLLTSLVDNIGELKKAETTLLAIVDTELNITQHITPLVVRIVQQAMKSEKIRVVLARVLVRLGNQYSAEFDQGVNQLMQQDDSEQAFEFISSTFGGSTSGSRFIPLKDSKSTLFLSLQHPNPQIRIKALEKYQDIWSTTGIAPSESEQSIMIQLIQDQMSDVVEFLLQHQLFQLLATESNDLLLESVLAALVYWKTQPLTFQIVLKALTEVVANESNALDILKSIVQLLNHHSDQIEILMQAADKLKTPFHQTLSNVKTYSEMVKAYGQVVKETPSLIETCVSWNCVFGLEVLHAAFQQMDNESLRVLLRDTVSAKWNDEPSVELAGIYLDVCRTESEAQELLIRFLQAPIFAQLQEPLSKLIKQFFKTAASICQTLERTLLDDNTAACVHGLNIVSSALMGLAQSQHIESVFPFLVVCLGHSCQHTREAALKCCQSIQEFKEHKYHSILQHYLKFTQDIQLDRQAFRIQTAQVASSVILEWIPKVSKTLTMHLVEALSEVRDVQAWERLSEWYINHLTTSDASILSSCRVILSKYQKAEKKISSRVIQAVFQTIQTTGPLQRVAIEGLETQWYGLLNQVKDQRALLSLLMQVIENCQDQTLPTVVHKAIVRLPFSVLVIQNEFQSGRLMALMEMLQYKIPTMEKSQVSVLFQPLQAALGQLNQQDESNEYLLQLILDAMNKVAQNCDSHTESDGVKTLVSSIFNALEQSNSPQTKNAALMLISSITDLFPAQVLKEMKSMMKHIEQSSVSQTDDYSFHIIMRIIQHVAPHLIQNDSVSPFVQNFIDVYDQIAATRRRALFTGLIQAFGRDYVPFFIVQLLHDTSRTEFIQLLLEDFAGPEQIQILTKLVDISKDESSSLSHELNQSVVSFIQLQLVEQSNTEEDQDEMYLHLAQSLLEHLRLSSIQEQDQEYWSAIGDSIFASLDTLQQMLKAPSFVAIISELLHHSDLVIRRKALSMFNLRVEAEHKGLSAGEQLLYLDLLQEIQETMLDTSTSAANIQTALLSVDVLARAFAETHPNAFESIFPHLVRLVDVPIEKTNQVTGTAFMCISTLFKYLGVLAIEMVPTVLSRLVDALEWLNATKGSLILMQCVLSSLYGISQSVSNFLNPYLIRLYRSLVHPNIVLESSADVKKLADQALVSLLTKVDSKQALPAFFASYQPCLVFGTTCTEYYFEKLGQLITQFTPRTIYVNLKPLVTFFLTTMDMRRLNHWDTIDVAESAMMKAFLAFVLKLSEKQLKPIFLKLSDWSKVSCENQIARQVSFYRLTQQLGSQLKSIFVPYFGYILEDSAELLTTAEPEQPETEEQPEDEFFDQGRPSKRSKTTTNFNTAATTRQLTKIVLEALTECFKHDLDGFMDKEKFNLLLNPIVSQLQRYETDSNVISSIVVPCIGHFAWAAKSDLLWKPLHYQILMQSRSTQSCIRLGALEALKLCYDLIGEEFLVMLPESIPFLSELLEDQDETVVTLCHQVIREIETLSGESLDTYLTS